MAPWTADGVVSWGGRPVARTAAEACPRRRAHLTGAVGAVSVRRQVVAGGPTPAVPGRPGVAVATEAELDDGTGSVLLRWSGRDGVPGVVVGARLVVEGTVLADHGRPVLLNPLYRFA
ncbi:MAG TPA: hypothetical protein VHB02_04060 [Acidimicrobiales bacterium]|nr:hypothetical protein [Acidimicrobiales bacterium]